MSVIESPRTGSNRVKFVVEYRYFGDYTVSSARYGYGTHRLLHDAVKGHIIADILAVVTVIRTKMPAPRS